MTVSPADLAATWRAREAARDAAHRETAMQLRESVRAWAQAERAAGRVDAVWLIGSMVDGTFGEGSDVDVVVRGLRADEGDARNDLVTRLRREVDLLPLERLPASFAERVLREGERLA